MRHTIKFLSIAFAACAAPAALAANDSGTITFTGSVSEAVCQVQITDNGSITLDNVMPSTLTSTGASSGIQNFNIILNGAACTNGQTPQLTFDTANFDPATGYLINTAGSGGAEGVALQLLEGLNPITTPSTVLMLATIADQSSTHDMGVRYVRTADPLIKSGKISSAATFTITYE